jgi:hypothetical protein
MWLQEEKADENLVDRCDPPDNARLQRCHGASERNGQPDAHPWCDLAAWLRDEYCRFTNRHPPWLHRNRISRRQPCSRRRDGHDRNAEQHHDMFDHRDRANVHVRIDRDLRRRRNDDGDRGARYRGNVGHDGDIKHDGNIGNVDINGNLVLVRDTGNLGHDWNVRFRLEQHCFIVDANIHGADSAGRRRSNRTSVGIYRDRQSWGQLRGSRADDDLVAYGGRDSVGTDHTDGYVAVRRFVSCDKPFPVPKRRHRRLSDGRLLKSPFNRELDQS